MLKTLLALGFALLATPVMAQGVPVNYTTAPTSWLALTSTNVGLYGFELDPGSVNGVAMVFNASSPPANGPVTPVACYTVRANQTLAVSYLPWPIILSAGAVIVFGTDSGLSNHCFTLTAQNAAFISGSAQ